MKEALALRLLTRSHELRGNNAYDADFMKDAAKEILVLQDDLRTLKSITLGIECIATNKMQPEEYSNYLKSKLAVIFQGIIEKEENNSDTTN